MTGGCHCGEIRYRLTEAPKVTTVCHCRACQLQSGSAFGMSAIVRRDAFRLERGTVRTFERTAESGLRVTGAFCGTCGVRIYHDLERNPTTRNVKPGTLDDRSTLKPAIHVWTSSRQGWFELPEGVPCFERNPGAE